jgi:hypothetical protein
MPRDLTDTHPEKQVVLRPVVHVRKWQHWVLKEQLSRDNELHLLHEAAVLLQLTCSSPFGMERLVPMPLTESEGGLEALERASNKLPRAGIDMQRKGYQAIQTELLDSQHRLETLRHRLPPNLKPLARQEILNSRGPSWTKVILTVCGPIAGIP